MIRSALLAALLLLSSSGARAEVAVEAALRHHIQILADDAMEGRKPGTPGGDRAVAYIAGQFAAAGLRPAGRDGNWYLPVWLIERTPLRATSRWQIGGAAVDLTAGEQYWHGRDMLVRLHDAPLIYAGYGIEDEATGLRSLGTTDVRGAVVLIHPGRPEGQEGAAAFGTRAADILARGAAAVVLVARPSDPWDALLEAGREGSTKLAEDLPPLLSGGISNAAWQAIATRAGLDAAALLAAAAQPGFGPRALGTVSVDASSTVRSYRSWNVAGRLPGRHGHESLLYLAHWDHLGFCRPPGAADRICNGAVDNASGVAMLIELARGLAAGPRLDRDILFVATTAEEMGLLGAKALAEDPPVPIDRIAAVLNFDTVAIAPAGEPVSIIGRGRTGLDRIVDAVAREIGRAVDASDTANSYLQRQDGWAFARKGVPSAMVGGSFSDQALLEGFIGGRYHKPDDDLARPLILSGVAEDLSLHVALAHALADPARFPIRSTGN